MRTDPNCSDYSSSTERWATNGLETSQIHGLFTADAVGLRAGYAQKKCSQAFSLIDLISFTNITDTDILN